MKSYDTYCDCDTESPNEYCTHAADIAEDILEILPSDAFFKDLWYFVTREGFTLKIESGAEWELDYDNASNIRHNYAWVTVDRVACLEDTKEGMEATIAKALIRAKNLAAFRASAV